MGEVFDALNDPGRRRLPDPARRSWCHPATHAGPSMVSKALPRTGGPPG